MCGAAQHPGTQHEPLDCTVIQLLIQKEAGFLLPRDTHEVADVVFPNPDFRVEGRREEALMLLHSLPESLFCVTPFINTAYR